jgi:hypothetical protein
MRLRIARGPVDRRPLNQLRTVPESWPPPRVRRRQPQSQLGVRGHRRSSMTATARLEHRVTEPAAAGIDVVRSPAATRAIHHQIRPQVDAKADIVAVQANQSAAGPML